DDLMQREGYALGDTIRLTAYFTLMDSIVFLDVWDLQIVGSYERQTRSATIYMPRLLCFANEFIPDFKVAALESGQPIEQFLPGEWLVNSVYSAVLTLDQTENLGSFRDRIEALGFTQVGKLAGRRIAIVIADKELEETVHSLKRQKQLMQILTPVVFFLTAIIGFIVSYLLSRHRQREYALMRSLGTRHSQSFLSFLLEQGLLFCAGLLPAGLFLLMHPEAVTAAGLHLLIFAVCYLAGTTLSIGLLRHRSVLDILLTKE
ncbi:MAG: FtsX-like permease family protein, partial [Bacillota bacterium]|nr:FtsX-like permease family protein [Bacillota bacterium]